MSIFKSIFQSIYSDVLWTPENITTDIWNDSADLSSIVHTGDTVTQLNDKSGNSRHMTASGTPKINQESVNGNNVITLLDPDYFVHNSYPVAADGNQAFYIVARIDAIDDSSDGLLAYNSTASDFRLQAQNVAQFDGRVSMTGAGNDNLNYTSGPFTALTIFEIILNKTGSQSKIYANGTNEDTQAYLTSLSLDGNQDLFLFANSASSAFPSGILCEFIGIPDITDITRQKIEGYLAWKWGLVSALPAGHPYKASPPILN